MSFGRRTVHPPPNTYRQLDHPALSVVCVVLRDPEGLLRTLESIPSVPHKVEVVIVDGEGSPSTTMSEDVRSEIARLRATVVSGPDDGPYDAMNRGILSSTGDWLWFLNAGDVRHSDLDIDGLLAALSASRAAWAVGAIDIVADTTVVYNRSATGEEILRGLASQPHQGTFVHRRGLSISGLFDTRYRIAADYAMMCRLAIAEEPHQLGATVATFYRGGISTTMRRRMFMEIFVIRSRTGAHNIGFVLRDLAWSLKHAAFSSKLPSTPKGAQGLGR